ncbi:SGNH/GDSL hydrolase family protein [Rhizobium phage RHph_Y65]|uniref:SGNH/GDSL hydrolase family protein n=1 Tax=Rhizobium phage RHph_Y65 TaxID=2509785 RepID=A0A7S5UW30_9CAUD|nr:lysophospholipase L1-like esterase [Rhizobium phage RHph_Y65]QIG72870.1 SGNH/GDSL hydrolase family protein [Rhizobium phage RHph_Y65]
MAISKKSLKIVNTAFNGRRARPVDPSRYMFFATRNRVPSGNLVTAASGTNYLCSKIIVNTPSYATRSFKFHLSGFAATEGGNSPQETVVTGTIGTPGNSVVVDALFIKVAGVFYQCKFSGLDTITIADQSNGAWTDELTLRDVAPESEMEIWTFYHTAVGEKVWPVYRIQKHRGERIWGASDLNTLLAYKDTPLADCTPSLDINYILVTQPSYYGPDFMVAKGDWDGRPVVLAVVDSIGESRQEYSAGADARGNLGWLRRWLDKADGIGRLPHFMIGMPGSHSVLELTGSGSTIATRRWAILDEITAFNNNKKPFTVILNQMGQNDTSTVYTTFFNTNYRSLVTRLRARYPGVKIVATTPLGRTTTTRTVTLTSVGTVVTAAIASGTNGLVTGQTVSISGATQTEYNGNVIITVTGPNSFTYNFAGSATTPATGSITASNLYLQAEFQSYSSQNSWPADGTDNSGKWRLRNDILAKTSSCCDDSIDTYYAWASSVKGGAWPGTIEMPSTTVTVQAGTDGVETYSTIQVANANLFRGEQEINTYAAPDGIARISTTTVLSVSGNTLTLSIPRATILPVGSIVRPSVTQDGVHPYPIMMDRIANGIPASEKNKLIT